MPEMVSINEERNIIEVKCFGPVMFEQLSQSMETVARNRGIMIRLLASRREAIHWLEQNCD